MSERAVLWVRPIGRAVTLRLAGESPLRYFDAAPHVRVLVGDHEAVTFDPAADFEQTVTVSADLLAAANGVVSEAKFFCPLPEPRQRHLALRV